MSARRCFSRLMTNLVTVRQGRCTSHFFSLKSPQLFETVGKYSATPRRDLAEFKLLQITRYFLSIFSKHTPPSNKRTNKQTKNHSVKTCASSNQCYGQRARCSQLILCTSGFFSGEAVRTAFLSLQSNDVPCAMPWPGVNQTSALPLLLENPL